MEQGPKRSRRAHNPSPDTKNIDNVKTECEGTKASQSPYKGKKNVKEKKPKGKKGKKSNNNKDSLKKQILVFEIKDYKLSRRLKCKPICKVHGKGFNSWWEYCKHLVEMHGHPKKYPCKLCKKEYSSLKAFTVHCTKHEEDNKRFQCEICL